MRTASPLFVARPQESAARASRIEPPPSADNGVDATDGPQGDAEEGQVSAPTDDRYADHKTEIRTSTVLKSYASGTVELLRKSPRFDKLAMLRTVKDDGEAGLTDSLNSFRKDMFKWAETVNFRLHWLDRVNPDINYRVGDTNVTGARAASAILKDDGRIVKSFKS